MPRRQSPLHKALRAGSLALLLVGLVTRPVLIMVGEIHLVQHQARAVADERAHVQQHLEGIAHAHADGVVDHDPAAEGADGGHDHLGSHDEHDHIVDHDDHDHDHALFSGGHVKGSHSLMHQSGPGASIDGSAAMPQLQPLKPGTVATALPAAALPKRQIGAPFRPPIA